MTTGVWYSWRQWTRNILFEKYFRGDLCGVFCSSICPSPTLQSRLKQRRAGTSEASNCLVLKTSTLSSFVFLRIVRGPSSPHFKKVLHQQDRKLDLHLDLQLGEPSRSFSFMADLYSTFWPGRLRMMEGGVRAMKILRFSSPGWTVAGIGFFLPLLFF